MNKISMYFLVLCLITVSINSKASENDLFKAAREGDSRAIKKFVEQGWDINSINTKSYTPFILAAYYGHTEVLQTMVDLGANVCAVDRKGNNAFMGVAFKGHKKVALWLLENTACKINQQNYAGQTALMMASLFGREQIVTSLLAYGADPKIQDRQGNTSIKLAQAQGLSRVVEIIQFHFQ